MRTLPQILKMWHLDNSVLTSPPIRDKKLYEQIRQLLIRSMIRAEYIDTHRVIKISLNPLDSPGRTNVKRLEQMNVTW